MNSVKPKNKLICEKIFIALSEGEKTKRDLVKISGMSTNVFDSFLCVLTENMPIYEYSIGNQTFYGLLI